MGGKRLSTSKIVIGVPFYGYIYTVLNGGETGLYQSFSEGNSITYDDELSLSYKADYINQNNLAGVSIWELSQNRSGQLLNALATKLKLEP